MDEIQEKAIKKIDTEKKQGKYDRFAAVMKNEVCEALKQFAGQDAEFAQAILAGKPISDCMKEVARNCGTGLSDLEAFRRAVRFYAPEASVEFQMSVTLPGEKPGEKETPAAQPKRKVISLADFM